MDQEVDDEDRQTPFRRDRPDGFSVNEKEHMIYTVEFQRVTEVKCHVRVIRGSS